MGEADAFEVGEMLAELFEALVVDAAAAMAHFGDFAPVAAFRIGFAGDGGADEREGFEVFKPGKGRHTGIGEFAVVGETQRFEVRELAEWRDPFVVGFGGDDVEGFERGDVAEVLEEGGVIRIVFAVVMRTCVWHGEIDEFQALTVFGFLDLAFGGLDDAGDGLNMRIEGEGRGGEEG